MRLDDLGSSPCQVKILFRLFLRNPLDEFKSQLFLNSLFSSKLKFRNLCYVWYLTQQVVMAAEVVKPRVHILLLAVVLF